MMYSSTAAQRKFKTNAFDKVFHGHRFETTAWILTSTILVQALRPIIDMFPLFLCEIKSKLDISLGG